MTKLHYFPIVKELKFFQLGMIFRSIPWQIKRLLSFSCWGYITRSRRRRIFTHTGMTAAELGVAAFEAVIKLPCCRKTMKHCFIRVRTGQVLMPLKPTGQSKLPLGVNVTGDLSASGRRQLRSTLTPQKLRLDKAGKMDYYMDYIKKIHNTCSLLWSLTWCNDLSCFEHLLGDRILYVNKLKGNFCI